MIDVIGMNEEYCSRRTDELVAQARCFKRMPAAVENLVALLQRIASLRDTKRVYCASTLQAGFLVMSLS